MSAFEVIVIMLCIAIGSIVEGVMAAGYGETVIATPKEFYENTKMNWFGCWFCYIIIRIFSPIVTVIGGIILTLCAIVTFIEWLFTVGRKDEE